MIGILVNVVIQVIQGFFDRSECDWDRANVDRFAFSRAWDGPWRQQYSHAQANAVPAHCYVIVVCVAITNNGPSTVIAKLSRLSLGVTAGRHLDRGSTLGERYVGGLLLQVNRHLITSFMHTRIAL